MTQVDPGINLKNPEKQDGVPKWYQICANLAYILEEVHLRRSIFYLLNGLFAVNVWYGMD